PNDLLESRTATKEQRDAANRFLIAKARETEIKSEMNLARSAYLQAAEYFNKLDEAETAYAEERFDDISSILYAYQDANSEILKDTEASLEERVSAYDDAITQTTGKMKLAVKSASQEEVNMILSAMEETVKYGQQAGIKGKELFSQEFIDGVQELLDKGFDISELASWAKDSGVDIGDVFKDDFTDVVQKQLDKGYDIGALLRWGLNSGADVGNDFKNNYTSIVQSQLDKGYDIRELLVWGQNSGIDISTLFTNEFTSKFQSALDFGFDCTGLIQWAIDNGWNLGEVFGDSFQTAYTQYIYAVDDLIPKNINSQWDAEQRRSGRYATGGHLGIGQSGIIAEAGPELLEVMNGGVRITPLTRNAQNTPVQTSPGGAGGSTKIYNNYISATIKDSYDVYKLAEDMSTAERIMDNARGV
ncbi:MAG TPA: hypothetical protein PLY43_06210, partial [Ruminococcus sp.]|nr:hypothetical protein [Ruminococcus sp.]